MSRQKEGMVRGLLRRPLLVLPFGLALGLALIADVSGDRIADGYALSVTMPGLPLIAALGALGAVWWIRRRARRRSAAGDGRDGSGDGAADGAVDGVVDGAGAGIGDDPDGPVDRIVVRAQRAITIVDVDEISHVEAAGRYARIHTADRDHLARYSLSDLEQMLDPSRFVRVHRSAIVNLGRIRSMRTTDYRDFDLLLDDGATVRLSRNYRDRLESALGLPI